MKGIAMMMTNKQMVEYYKALPGWEKAVMGIKLPPRANIETEDVELHLNLDLVRAVKCEIYDKILSVAVGAIVGGVIGWLLMRYLL